MSINDQVAKAKKFVSDHDTAILFISGAIVGSCATVLLAEHNPLLVNFTVRRKDMKTLSDKGGAIVFNPYRGEDYCLIQSPFK